MEISLRARIKHYKRRVDEIENYLNKNPHEWGRFQSEFNAEVNVVFQNILNFEKENIFAKNETKIYKLKQLFIRYIRKIFERGEFINWSLHKPLGYAGDYKIIENIYENNPLTAGVDRLFDNYFMMSAISIAVRNRKNDFKRMITDFVADRQGIPLRIMVLASGPCRELRELYAEKGGIYKNVTFDCYDCDPRAIEFSTNALKGISSVNFIHENAARIAFRKDITTLIKTKYDVIYSTGLFDYFEERVSTRLIANLRKLLNPGGIMIISNVRDKYSNPSVHFMEWVGEWELVYCESERFRKYFLDAGFNREDISQRYEQQGILQYIIANKP